MPNYLELESLSANLSKKNLIDRFDYLTNNQKELFSLNLDKKIANPKRYIMVDASLSKDIIHKNIIKKLKL